MSKRISNRKGMVWTTDFLIGLMLFLVMILIAVKILLGMNTSQAGVSVYRDAVYVSDNLLSEGYPFNWTNQTVIMPGIAGNNRINTTKLSNFTDIDYYRVKELLHVSSDFIFFIRNSTDIINTSRCIYGYNLTTDENCTPRLDTITYDNLVRMDRIVLYQSKVVTLTVYAWV